MISRMDCSPQVSESVCLYSKVMMLPSCFSGVRKHVQKGFVKLSKQSTLCVFAVS